MRPQCLGMMTFTEQPSAPSDHLVPFTDQLRLAVAAYLARFKGSSRYHTDSDLRCYLAWCVGHGLDPLAARRPHLELYIRWMQEIRRFKPSTVSRRLSVAAGFYRTCVIDGLLEHSPAEHVRRPLAGLGSLAAPGRDTQELRDAVEALHAQFEPPTSPQPAEPATVLHLHGGAYMAGSAFGYRPLAGCLADAARAGVLVLDYRLAPEHPFPAAVEDAMRAYLWMLDQGTDAAQVAVTGDSAGAGLALSLLLTLRQQDLQMPGPPCSSARASTSGRPAGTTCRPNCTGYSRCAPSST